METLRRYIATEWPENSKLCENNTQEYYKYKHEISAQGSLLFRNGKIIIPQVLRPYLLKRIH